MDQIAHLLAAIIPPPRSGQEGNALGAQGFLVVFERGGGLKQERDIAVGCCAPRLFFGDQGYAAFDQLAQPAGHDAGLVTPDVFGSRQERLVLLWPWDDVDLERCGVWGWCAMLAQGLEQHFVGQHGACAPHDALEHVVGQGHQARVGAERYIERDLAPAVRLHRGAHVAEDADIRASEAIDRLLAVADDEQPPQRRGGRGAGQGGCLRGWACSFIIAGQGIHQVALCGVGVLELVHQDGRQFALPACSNGGVFLQQPQRAGLQVVEIEHVLGLLCRSVVAGREPIQRGDAKRGECCTALQRLVPWGCEQGSVVPIALAQHFQARSGLAQMLWAAPGPGCADVEPDSIDLRQPLVGSAIGMCRCQVVEQASDGQDLIAEPIARGREQRQAAEGGACCLPASILQQGGERGAAVRLQRGAPAFQQRFGVGGQVRDR